MNCPHCQKPVALKPVGIDEASEILGISKRWLYAAYNNKEITNLPKRLAYPGKWLFDIADLIEWKEQNKK